MKKKLIIEASIDIKDKADPTFPVYPGNRTLLPSEPSKSLALREAKRANESTFNRVWKFVYERQKTIELTDFELEILKRLNNAWYLLTGKLLNDRKAVLAHVTWCKDNCMTISERTAYDDISRAKMLFGDPRVSMAMFEKARMSTILLDQMQLIKEYVSINPGQTIEGGKVLNLLIRRYNAVNGLEEDIKTQIPRPAITINFNADPETLKRQAEELMKGVTIDTEYSEE